MFRTILLFGALSACACGVAQPELDGPTLDGVWLLRGSPMVQSCAGRLWSFPFAPEPVELITEHDGVTLESPDAGRVPYTGDGRVLRRSVVLDEAVLTSTWRIAAVSQTRLSAELHIEAVSSDQICSLRFGVSGVRP